MPTNALLVRFEAGWAERTTDDDPERIEATLALGAILSLAEAYRVADAQLDVFGEPREEIAVGVSPTLDLIGAGDTVTVDLANGGTGTERVQAVSVSDDSSNPDEVLIVYLVKDVVLEAQEAFEQAVKKMNNGTVGGAVASATPAVPSYVSPSV